LFFTPALTPAASASNLTVDNDSSIHHQRRDSLSSTSNDGNRLIKAIFIIIFTLEISSFASFDSSFEIDLWKIESGLEKRTTCMIRNIPNKYTQVSLYKMANILSFVANGLGFS
jgi:hypothetical protein